MKKHALFILTFLLTFLLTESCSKNDNSSYNPYNITETPTAEEIDQSFAKQMIDASSILPELIHLSMKAALTDLSLLDSVAGNSAEIRNGCPCVSYVPDAVTGGGVLTLTFDDGNGSCSTPGLGLLPKTYSGSIQVTFDNPPNIANNTFSLSLNNFTMENYDIYFGGGIDWVFTWDVFQDFFYGGFQSNLVALNTDNGDLTIYQPNPNDGGDELLLASFFGPTTTDPEVMVNRRFGLNTFDFTEGCCGPETSDFIKVTCQKAEPSGATMDFLMSVGDMNGNDLDPIVVDPMECGCYINGSIWIQPFDQSTQQIEHNFGYTVFGTSETDVCDATYLRRRFSGDPNGTLLTSEACEL